LAAAGEHRVDVAEPAAETHDRRAQTGPAVFDVGDDAVGDLPAGGGVDGGGHGFMMVAPDGHGRVRGG
jgi:hypothetical protein